jgi:ribosomal protein L32
MNRLSRTDARPIDAVQFCSHCGALAPDLPERVCAECGLGVLLSCAAVLLPRAGAAFLVVKTDLRIGAASAGVEPLLGDPAALVGKPLLDVLSGDPGLPRSIVRAAMGSQRLTSVALRRGPRRVNARIGACGDPPAALLVLE